MNLSHILVATDLSDEALSCVPDVAALAGAVGARITLLHVLESFEVVPQGSPLAPPIGPLANQKAMDAARAQLEQRRTAYGSDIPIETELLVGEAADMITTWAESHDVDLIAMTTHGRTGFRRLALGSVAESVLRRSRVPVLVLPLRRD